MTLSDATTTPALLVDAVLLYAKTKWPIFPINPQTKLPIIPTAHPDGDEQRGKCHGECGQVGHGFYDATTNEEALRAWWQRWPTAAIGLSTGPAGLIVVDVDPRHDGDKTWNNLTSKHGMATLDTCRAITGGGGMHFYYRPPQGRELRNTAGKLGPGIDTRGVGGYVLAPPSLHPSGNAYAWVNGHDPWTHPPVVLPDALLTLLDAKGEPGANGTSGPFTPPPRVPAGQHHTTLVQLAGQLTAKGWTRRAVADAVWAQAQATFDPPPSSPGGPQEDWVRRTANDVWDRYHKDAPIAPTAVLAAATPATSLPGTNGHNGHHPLVDDLPDGYPANDIGNALRFRDMHGANVRYVHDRDEWVVHHDGYWPIDDVGEITELAKRTALSLYGASDAVADNKQRRRLFQFAEVSGNSGKLESMVRLAQSLLPIKSIELDKDDWLLGVSNGLIDLKTGTLLPPDPQRFVTRRIPIKYDPDAKCPSWTSFMDTITTGDKDKLRFLQQATGYTLTGSIREQCIFFFFGSGSNGKSTFVRTLRFLLGPYAGHSEPSTFEQQKGERVRSDLARLQGLRFVSTAEGERGNIVSEGTIKKLTGGEPIVASFKFKDEFEFHPKFKLFWLTNHKPVIYGADKGTWRRVRFITFEHTFPEGDPVGLDERVNAFLRDEGPGILAWAVRGCLDWQKQNLLSNPPKSIKEATEEYREEMNPIAGFLSSQCAVGPEESCKAADIYEAYTTWCASMKEYAVPKRTFGVRLGELGFRSAKGTAGVRLWLGLRVLTDEQKRLQWDAENPVVQPPPTVQSAPETGGLDSFTASGKNPEAPKPAGSTTQPQAETFNLTGGPVPDEYMHPEQRRSLVMQLLRELVLDVAIGVDVAVLAARAVALHVRPDQLERDLRVLEDRKRIRQLPNGRLTLNS